MALFFITSGYLWNDKNAESLGTAFKYIKRKVKSLWIPFVISNGLFTLLNNFFIHIGFYSNNPEFLAIANDSHNSLHSYFNFNMIIKQLMKNICFFGDTQMGGATWFLRTLFEVSVCYLFVCFIWRKHNKTTRNIVEYIIFLLDDRSK